MTSRTIMLTFAAAALASAVSLTAPAQAQLTRTWVSGSVGNDANACTRGAPCATFAAAYAATAAFGEINCLDPGSFGALLIDKSITISCEAGTAGIIGHGAQGDAITVQAGASDIVHLRGLDLEGLGATNPGNSTYGILVTSVGSLHVEKCLIRSYTGLAGQAGNGIAFLPGANASLIVTDTVVAENGVNSTGGNIVIAPSGGSLVNVTLDNVQMLHGTFGLRVTDNGSTTIHVAVENSRAAGNRFEGFSATTTGGRLTMMVKRSLAANNGTYGVHADGANTGPGDFPGGEIRGQLDHGR